MADTQVQIVQYVQFAEFVTVIIAVVTLNVAGWAIIIRLIGKISERLSSAEQHNTNDTESIDGLWDAIKENKEKMEAYERERRQDILLFTEAIGELNVTLGKMETTMENTNNVMEKMEKRMERQDEQIGILREKVG